MSDVPLREYFETIIAANQRELAAKHLSMEASMLVARDEVARRLTELNQLRSEVIDDRDQFVSKNEFEPAMRERDQWREVVADRLNAVSDRITRIETKGNTWTVAIGIFFVLLQIALMIVLRTK